MILKNNYKIGIVGLGYVGFPLAIEFAKHFKTIGFDIDHSRIDELNLGFDRTLEVSSDNLHNSTLKFTFSQSDLQDCNIYIITVPTPIDKYNKPDLSHLITASQFVGELLNKGDIVIYESTVYPGCTEEDCVPVLEKYSNLKYNSEFYCGYSPERINPGDKINTLTKIKKVTSGSTPKIASEIDLLYKTIIVAGTHLAPSIKVAEASKAIENAQRDINISFVNELALMFDKMGIDTHDVIEAAGTKWNFLKYSPGLVGGHCISVDPYYLAHKAESLGYYPEVILSGRRVNSRMDKFVAGKAIKYMLQNGINMTKSKVLILGVTFKENCPDIRNTKIVGVVNELIDFGIDVDVCDPIANQNEVKEHLNITLINNPEMNLYKLIILAVPHSVFMNDKKFNIESSSSIIFDVKSVLPRNKSVLRL
ncbi:MAG: Vi polysaccharide biosynthesis protein VipA/TviB [Pelagibacterales bacterium]|nr:Vi polysaccharide biosynthesis protein VipA/TviB [Pelagibacterales bacterium]|tara:strand:- start:7252 stop:8517 length:1266 start_codon:yes stop_codon:yes gene_type:complete